MRYNQTKNEFNNSKNLINKNNQKNYIFIKNFSFLNIQIIQIFKNIIQILELSKKYNLFFIYCLFNMNYKFLLSNFKDFNIIKII